MKKVVFLALVDTVDWRIPFTASSFLTFLRQNNFSAFPTVHGGRVALLSKRYKWKILGKDFPS